LGELQFEASWANSSGDHHLQNNQSKMDWRCGSSVEYLLSKFKALNSNLSSTKNKTKTKEYDKETTSNE
jgi:hypothetical protein